MKDFDLYNCFVKKVKNEKGIERLVNLKPFESLAHMLQTNESQLNTQGVDIVVFLLSFLVIQSTMDDT